MGTALLQAVVNGLLIGSLYAVMAMGLAIIFGVMRVINLAHGEFIMLGMYLSFWVVTLLQAGRGVAMLIGLPIFLLFGAFLYRVFVNCVQQRSGEMGTLLITFGLAYIIANTAQIGRSADYRVLSAGSVEPLRVAGLSISVSLLWAFAIALLLTVATYVFLIYTDPGKAIRATSQDPQAAALMGVNVKRINMVAFGLGASLAGIAGILVSPVFYIYPMWEASFW